MGHTAAGTLFRTVGCCTLLPERALDLTVRVMNPTDRDIKLCKGVQCMLEEVELFESENYSDSRTRCAAVTEVFVTYGTTEIEDVLAPLWTEVAEDVPHSVRDRLRQLVLDNRTAFSLDEWDLGFTDVLQHEVDTGDETPVRQPLRRQPLSLLPVIDEQVQLMFQH